ncbi:MAG: hypothetical protein P0S93_02035 [Candidatus Neptunochlamydia sp.]|nr:hypothetical protein [Candidatus Neptunochlamydia sp.]
MKKKLTALLIEIMQSDILHAKWLNTLSYLENCGARKIAACEHPTLVKEEMLKHASEEFRHSHYLKKQIKKVSSFHFPNFGLSSLLGGINTLQYLNKLDVLISRFLTKQSFLDKSELKKIAYLLVTYAIEIRAQKFYPIYDQILREQQSKVYVKSIILEEEQHLYEMEEGIKKLPLGEKYAKKACSFENALFNKWIEGVEADLSNHRIPDAQAVH